MKREKGASNNRPGPWKHAKKLTAAKAREIRIRHRAGETVEALAEEYGTSKQAITDVLSYLTWAFAGPEPPGSGR